MESGKIIVVANQKGGVAKTSTVRNLSYALAEMGKKVLVRPASSPMGTTWYLSGKMTKEKRCLKLTTAPVNGGRRSICKWSR